MRKGSTGRFFIVTFLLMGVSLIIASSWDKFPAVKNFVDGILNPTAGMLINWNPTIGSLFVFFLIALVSTVTQKYLTDQETLRELRKEQKEINEEIKKYRDNPKKSMELQSSLMPTTMKMMEINMKGSAFTIIPMILLFRWFMEIFLELGNPVFFGFLSWFWFYLLSLISFSIILRKVLNVV
ncbi:MAG: EMC3/TMCO1 family protein [Nanoarchaeota archaeon]